LIVSDKVQSLEELFQKYPEVPFALDGIKHGSLTLEDFLLINRILIGCTKLMYFHKADCHDLYVSKKGPESRKSFAGLLAFDTILRMGTSDSVFRAKNVRTGFPEDVQKISYSDLSRILRMLKRVKLTDQQRPPNKKSGRPKSDEKRSHETNFYYSKSGYLLLLEKLITKPLARSILISLLVEAKVIQRYIEYSCLYALYEIKFFGLSYVLRTLQAREKLDTKQMAGYEKNLSVFAKIVNSHPKQMKSVAHKMAQHQMNIRDFKNDAFYNHYYIMGGIFYYA
jgi:hypothetical protein